MKKAQKEAAGSGSRLSPAGMLEEQQPQFFGAGWNSPSPAVLVTHTCH